MRNRERVLVVAPHCDDESFGCLGTLLKHQKNGDELSFLWFSQARRAIEGAQKVAKYFGSAFRYLGYHDQHFDEYPIVKLITAVEWALKYYSPTIVYIPFFGDLNKDHRLVSEATLVACRPYKKHAPTEVWMYEIPGTTEYSLYPFKSDRQEAINGREKYKLIKKWYPGELINGRDKICNSENFQRWPNNVNRA